MVKRLYLFTIPSLFLLIGVFALTVIPTTITSAISQFHDNKNSNILLNNNSNKSHLTNTTNPTLLKQLGLYTLSQQLNNAITNLMTIAETSMNRSNSFGPLSQVNVTDEMKLKYHGIPSDQDKGKRNEAKKLLANNKALLYVGLLLPNGDRYFGEPYFPYQTNSSTANFAYRDHFSSAIKTKQPYLK